MEPLGHEQFRTLDKKGKRNNQLPEHPGVFYRKHQNRVNLFFGLKQKDGFDRLFLFGLHTSAFDIVQFKSMSDDRLDPNLVMIQN